MAMSGFICHDDYLLKTAKLTDEEVGRLFRALMAYHATGEVNEIDGRESIAFDFIREDIDRTEEAYKAKCEKNRNNRLSALDNNRQRLLTNVNERCQKEKEKEEEKEKEKENKKDKKHILAHLDDLFDQFWAAYPRKTAKPDAHKAFVKLNPDDNLLQTMLNAIERQKQTSQWQEANGQFIPYPASWIRQTRWEDEPPQGKVSPIKPVVAQDYEQREYSETVYSSPEDMIKRLNEQMGITG